MSTDTDLRARLRDLADDAPRAGSSGEDLWRTGVRRQRLRRAAVVAGTAVAVALVVGVTSVIRMPSGPAPAEGPAELGIPRVVEAPDPWSEPVAAPGPLSAVSIAVHRAPDGLTGSRDQLQTFGVSASDGVSRFLDFPGHPVDLNPGHTAISPDGSRVATSRRDGVDGEVVTRGWDVLDVTTGEHTRLRVAGMRSLVGLDAYEISFSGDGRYLVTNFSLTGSDESREDSLVAWDVETGEPMAVEEAGYHWLPGPASGPTGVVWTRGHDVVTVDPASGDRTVVTVPHPLVDAVFSPDGERLAYIGEEQGRRGASGPWRFHVRAADGGIRTIDVGIEPTQVLGWRDDTHAVVSRSGPRGARVVDVTTGEWEPLPLSQDGDTLMTPRYATDLLARPVAASVEQPDADDPRFWMSTEVQWIAVGLLLGGVLQLWIVFRRRRGRG